MKVNPINTGQIHTPQRLYKTSGPSAFGSDKVSIGEGKEFQSVSSSDLSQLFKAKRTAWSYPVGFSKQGMTVTKDGSLFVARGSRRDSTLIKLNPKTGEVEWEKNFGSEIESKPIHESPDGTIFIRTADRKLRALTPDKGEEKWSFNQKLGSNIPKFGSDGTIFTGCDGDLTALSPSGEEKYTIECGDLMHYPAAVDSQGTIVKSEDEVISYDADGKESWRVEAETVDAFPKDPNHVYTANEDGITARDRKTGEKLWERPEKGLHYKYDLEGSTGNRLFIGHHGEGKLKCVDTATGKNLWERETKLRTRLIDENGTIYQGGDYKFEAVDPKTGKTKWSVDSDHNSNFGEAVKGSNDVLFINDEKKLYGIDSKTGEVVFKQGVDDKITGFSLNEKENMVYIMGLESEKLTAFSLVDLKPFKGAEEQKVEKDPGEIKVKEKFVEIGGVKLPVNLSRRP